MAWVGPSPARRHRAGETVSRTAKGLDRPVVAVLDTGTGTHPWLGDDVVVRNPTVLGVPIGPYPAAHPSAGDSEVGGMAGNPLTGGLDPASGHGTFIAGLVHQGCPDAVILSARLYGGEGAIPEWDLLSALRRLLIFHVLGLHGRTGYHPVDVLNLSLGYYHERPEDAAFDQPFARSLAALARHGVVVVVSAGNDGDPRPLYPAAFAPLLDLTATPPAPLHPAALSAAELPVLTVGALNPDGTTALFSNDGPWVTCLRPGAAVVSTLPTTLDGSVAATRDLAGRRSGERRATMDPDGFGGGFGVWSGTSFATPVLAGELAAALLARREQVPPPAPGGSWADAVAARCTLGWQAVAATTGLAPGS